MFELTEKEFDFMLFWIRSHVAEFFVLLATDDFINRPGDSIGNGYLSFVGGAEAKLPAIVFSPVKRSAL